MGQAVAGADAQQHWRRLNGAYFLPEVIQGTIFIDGLFARDAA